MDTSKTWLNGNFLHARVPKIGKCEEKRLEQARKERRVFDINKNHPHLIHSNIITEAESEETIRLM